MTDLPELEDDCSGPLPPLPESAYPPDAEPVPVEDEEDA